MAAAVQAATCKDHSPLRFLKTLSLAGLGGVDPKACRPSLGFVPGPGASQRSGHGKWDLAPCRTLDGSAPWGGPEAGSFKTLLSCQGWARAACRLCGPLPGRPRLPAAVGHLPPPGGGSRTFPRAQLRSGPYAGSFRPVLASSCPQEQAGLPASLCKAPSPFVSLRMCVQVLPLETTSYFLHRFLCLPLASFEEWGMEREPCGCCPFRCVLWPQKSEAGVGRGL